MSDPTDELRRHLNHVLSILEPYALATGPINKQNVEVAIGLAHVYLRRAPNRQAAVMTLEMLIHWHQQRAGECFAILSRATHMPKAEAEALKATAQFHIKAVRLLQTFEL